MKKGSAIKEMVSGKTSCLGKVVKILAESNLWIGIIRFSEKRQEE